MPRLEVARTRTVALVDWLWAGHHPAWFGLFASALSELGHDVVPICPYPEDVGGLVDAGTGVLRGRVHPGYRMHFFTNVRGSIPARARPIWATIRHFARIRAMVRDWEMRSGKRIDLIFFACIFDDQFRHIAWADAILGRPWSGLYIHARSIRMPGSALPGTKRFPCPEAIFGVKGAQSVAVLDEAAVEPLSTMIGGKKVVVFPDLADERLPADDNDGLAGKLRRFSAGRPVVGVLGHLKPSKGVLDVIRAARDPSLAEVCFAFVGEVSLGEFSKQEAAEVLEFWQNDPRVFCYPLRVPDGASFNSVLRACDAIYAAYRDFPNSSNLLTKAALVQRPVIVSDGYLMAERVRRFEMGLVVPEGDLVAIRAAILALTLRPRSGFVPESARWSAYLAEHSFGRLVQGFSQILD
jgi:glycosyltransferase involved in cell wall biosynthesis